MFKVLYFAARIEVDRYNLLIDNILRQKSPLRCLSADIIPDLRVKCSFSGGVPKISITSCLVVWPFLIIAICEGVGWFPRMAVFVEQAPSMINEIINHKITEYLLFICFMLICFANLTK